MRVYLAGSGISASFDALMMAAYLYLLDQLFLLTMTYRNPRHIHIHIHIHLVTVSTTVQASPAPRRTGGATKVRVLQQARDIPGPGG